jgi:transcriptional regulator, araC family
MDTGLHYNIKLSDDVSNILSSDFWILEHIGKQIIPTSPDPLKFSATVSILIMEGECVADINLIRYEIKAPCIVNIRRAQILQIKSVSDDFDAACIVMSNRFTDNLFLKLKDCPQYSVATRNQVVEIPTELLPRFIQHVGIMAEISSDTANPYAYQAEVLAISSFFYSTGHKCYHHLSESFPKTNNRIPDRFINLVQQNFKKERFLEFYANKLEITPKHLSRTMKALTGFTAVEWIERFVVLEAKVLLKSTNLTIQQIADELNFPSQSFFGKYFKKNMGMSPKEFRNS